VVAATNQGKNPSDTGGRLGQGVIGNLAFTGGE
jgi:hypothetical protein